MATDPVSGSTGPAVDASSRSKTKCSRCGIVLVGRREPRQRWCDPYRRLLGAGLAVKEKHGASQETEEPRRSLRRTVGATGPEHHLLLSPFRTAFRNRGKTVGWHASGRGRPRYMKNITHEALRTRNTLVGLGWQYCCADSSPR